jgi:hypothetical protein
LRAALERHPQHALQLGQIGGLLADEQASKCMERRQPGVAGSDAVVTLGLKKSQEVSNLLGGEVAEVQSSMAVAFWAAANRRNRTTASR